jgi:hypothetical protein
MVEVFKTNVTDWHQAKWLTAQIHRKFTGYQANFDLEDCDHILRVKCRGGAVQASGLIKFLKEAGCEAQVLPDVPSPAVWIQGGIELKYKNEREVNRQSCNNWV